MGSQLVSVVIPTIGRPELREAVQSALRQRDIDVEVIVVVDGDSERLDRVRSLCVDLHVRTVRLQDLGASGSTGGNAARNAGVTIAAGDAIAFLDDDDVWADTKLSSQLENAGGQLADRTLYTCQVETFGSSKPRQWPVIEPSDAGNLEKHLFWRRSLRPRPGHLQTSTWLGKRDLFVKYPFNEELTIHQDWDWLVRYAIHGEVVVSHLHQPLVAYRESDAQSTSRRPEKLNRSRNWIETSQLDQRSIGDALLAGPFRLALTAGDFKVAREIRRTATRRYAPGLPARLVATIAFWRARSVVNTARDVRGNA